jgi:subtilase family serine protease
MSFTRLPRFLVTSAICVIGLVGFGAPAAIAAVQNNLSNRINVPVSTENQVAIAESVHPRARLAADLGQAPANTRLQGMSIRFSMTAAQEAALDQLLVDLQDPSSPRYHQWLTPAQFAAQFGLSSGDIARVSAWLTSQGFTVTGVAKGGTFVTFDGTVAQAQAAFSTSIHSLSLHGESHFANVTNAQVPTAFASVVRGVTGLHDFRLKPRVRASVVKPQYTSSVSSSHYLAPGDLYTIYDMNPLLTNAINGTGVTIAVAGQVQIALSDIAAFRSASGLSASAPTLTPVNGGALATNNCSAATSSNCPSPNLDDLSESSLDVEWSGAMAPSATVLSVNGPDVIADALTQAIDKNLAPIVTLSYGNCEAGWGSTEINILNQIFKQANAQGQTVLAASADVGATDCDNGASAIEGLTVDFPASSPYVTGMGGTMFNEGNATGTTQYWNANSTSTIANAGSAIGYIPETVWNENTPGSFFSAGGGGVSAFFSKPAWQIETGATGMTTLVPPDASRDVPDLALDAASLHDGFLFCSQGFCTNGFRNASSNLNTAGGTSFDSQLFGGMLALVVQKFGRIGNANPKIYALGNSVAYYNNTSSSVFHDATTGNNSNPCTAGTLNCPYGGSIGYNAGTGYDLATGWGSVDLNNLVNAWNVITPLGIGSLGPNISATALTASSSSVAAAVTGSPTVTLTANVTGFTVTTANPLATTPGPTPTGTVQFLVNNVVVGSGTLNASGVATFAFATSCSTLGQQSITAAYAGSPTYAGSIGPALASAEAGRTGGAGISSDGSVITVPVSVNVTAGTCPYYSLTPANSTTNVASGGTIPTVAITVAPLNNFIGTVTFTASSSTTSGHVPTLSFSPATITFGPTNNTASQTTTLTFSGITANLRMPNAPGQIDSGTMLAQHGAGRTPWYAAGSGLTIASLLMLMLPRRRRLGGLLLLALSIALVGGATGCGASSLAAPPPTSTNPFAGTYVVNIIGTSTSPTTGQVLKNSTTATYVIN